jgi:hypothetical protein
MRSWMIAASALLALAVAVPALAQGNSGAHKPSTTSPGNSGSAPGRNRGVPSSNVSPATATGVVPFAWIDDASMLNQGAVALSISAFRWSGSGVSEVDLPIVGVSVGAAPRFQIGASIPNVIDNPDAGVVGGLGTTYISGKIGLLTGNMVKLAAAPTLQILGDGALQSFTAGERRTQFGLPVSIEGDSGIVRVFASGGGFSPGIWFAGGGVGVSATSQVSVSGSFSRAWTNASETTVAGSSRQELSGTVAYSPTSQFTVFGSVGHTVATTDANGAGATVSGGMVFVVSPKRAKP